MNRRPFPALAILMITAASSAARADDTFVGQVVAVTGKVLIRAESSQTMQMTFVKPGDKIVKGSIVNTSSNGTVKLLMTDRTIIDLGPSSLFKVNEYQLNSTSDRKIDVSVDYGQIRANVTEKVNSDKGKFTIRTKAATMGVRGTEFVVNAGQQPPLSSGMVTATRTSITVMEGTVEVAGGKTGAGPVRVTPGMQFQQSGESAPQVAQLNLQQVALVRNDALQRDTTFLQAVVIEPAAARSSDGSGRGASEKWAEKSAEKAEKKGDGIQGPSPASTAGGPSSPINLTMAGVVDNLTVNSAAIQPVQVSDLRLPGVMTGPVVPPQAVQIIQGLPKTVQVIFNPN